jgi:hypothetical protein
MVFGAAAGAINGGAMGIEKSIFGTRGALL